MEIQEIEVTIDKNGQVRVHVHGVEGPTCLELTKELEEALGGNILSREMTAESLDDMDNPLDQNLHIKGSS